MIKAPALDDNVSKAPALDDNVIKAPALDDDVIKDALDALDAPETRLLLLLRLE